MLIYNRHKAMALIQASESIYPVAALVGALVGAFVATGGLVTF